MTSSLVCAILYLKHTLSAEGLVLVYKQEQRACKRAGVGLIGDKDSLAHSPWWVLWDFSSLCSTQTLQHLSIISKKNCLD